MKRDFEPSVGFRPEFELWLDRFIVLRQTECVAFAAEHERMARSAFDQFGKGRHRAALNYGDCVTYAIAMAEGLPLLFKGGDFGLTDVRVHPASVLTAAADI